MLLRGRRAAASTRTRGRASTRATTSRCCASPGLERAGAAARRRPGAGHVGRDPRLPAQRARTTCAPARLGATRDGHHPGRLRPRAGAARDHVAARRACARGNSGGPMVDGARPRRDDGLRRHDERPARRLRRARTRSCATALAGARERGRRPAPAPAEPGRYPPPANGQDPRHRREAVRRPRPRARAPRPVRRSTRATSRSDEHVVTWAVGHLVQLAEPDEYDPKFKKWRMADLPIVPDRVQARRARRALAQAADGRSPGCSARDDVDADRQRLRRRPRGRADLRLRSTRRPASRSRSSGCGCPR